MRGVLVACGIAALALSAAPTAGPVVAIEVAGTFGSPQGDEALVKRARAIHDRVLTLDTHDDINPDNFTPERNYTQDLPTQVNLPKMVKGGLDAAFFIVYVGQGPLTPEGFDGAYKQAIAKFDAVDRLTKQIAPDKIELALTAADVQRIYKSGKKVALIGAGVGVGLILSVAVSRLVERGLLGLTRGDAGLTVAVAGTLIVVALAAAYIPARRAAAIDPSVALRAE